MADKNWKKLQDYCCPTIDCQEVLQEYVDYRFRKFHKCASCDFIISEEKLKSIAVLRNRVLEPPDFIKEMRENQEKLNNL